MMRSSRRTILGALCGLLLAFSGPVAAQAAFDDPIIVFTPPLDPKNPLPPPTGYLEGPCGLVIDSSANLYVSDYYHHAVDVFNFDPVFFLSAYYLTQIANVDPLDGPCGLSLGSTGTLYVNNYHRNVERYVPAAFPVGKGTGFGPPTTIDSNHPTGVAVNTATNAVYVNARTHINVYDSSGAPVMDGSEPLRIGVGSLEDGYGLAVSGHPATLGRIYVPDYADNTVKVYDPLIDKDDPVQVIGGPPGGFGSLRDSAVAVDNVTGEIYVSDTLAYPQYTERPEATVQVFDAAGTHKGRLKHNIVDASPAGLAVDNSPKPTQGLVYVTSGNTIDASVYGYAPGSATVASAPPLSVAGFGTGSREDAYAPDSDSAAPTRSAPKATASELAQKGKLRISVSGRISPKRLPRRGTAPVSVSVGGEISTTDKSPPPQLRSLRIELHRGGRLDSSGLPTCDIDRIQPGSSSRALSACRSALVGTGSFGADIDLSGQEPYPTRGKLLVFNARQRGKPVLLGHIYSKAPFATSFVIVFELQKLGGRTYGTALSADLPAALGNWGNLTALQMTLQRRYTYRGKLHSFISAGCPAPKGFPGALFPLARTTFGFESGAKLAAVLTSNCKARG